MKDFGKYILPLLGIGLLAGFLNGLLGAAGGIAVVLGLRALFRNKPIDGHSFYTTAIAVMLPLSCLSAWRYARGGHLPSVSPWGLILPAVLGGALGALLLKSIKPQLLKRIFAAVVLVSGIILAV